MRFRVIYAIIVSALWITFISVQIEVVLNQKGIDNMARTDSPLELRVAKLEREVKDLRRLYFSAQ